MGYVEDYYLAKPPVLSSSLGLLGGDDDCCAGFDADFSINKTISALFHSTREPRARPMVVAPSSMG